MRGALAASLLLHAAALAAAWPVVAGSRGARDPAAVELHFRVERPPAPQALPAAPALPREHTPPPRDPPPDPPAPGSDEEFVAQGPPPVVDTAPMANARLRRPLVRTEPRAEAAPAVAPARAPVPAPAPGLGAAALPTRDPAAFVPPRLRDGTNTAVAYPETARRLGLEGRTVLRVEVDAEGRVADVAVVESSGHPMLDEAAVDAVSRWRFEPARRGGLPTGHRLRVPIRFALE